MKRWLMEVVIVVLAVCGCSYCAYSLDDVDLGDAYNGGVSGGSSLSSSSSDNVGQFEWDSSFYDKPICTRIPSNMSICANLNYDHMKVPNFLGHDSIEEIVYQSSVWQPLLSIECHADAKLFLCSMFAPICVSGSSSSPPTIYPCRSLCLSVKQSCETKMLAYNYPWPSMFNCSRFPDENGLCISSQSLQQASPPVQNTRTRIFTTTTTTTRKPITKITKISKTNEAFTATTRIIRPTTTINAPISTAYSPQMPDLKLNDNTCYGCHNDEFSMENIVRLYCNSDLVLRGRIQTIKISNLELSEPRKRQQQQRLNRKGQTNLWPSATNKSLYVRIAKRDRKFLKGMRLVANMGSFFMENKHQTMEEPDVDSNEHDLDIYLMSQAMLGGLLINNNNNNDNYMMARKIRLRSSMMNGSVVMNQNQNNRQQQGHCVCDKLRRTSRRINTKYLLFANVLRTKALVDGGGVGQSVMRHRLRVRHHNNNVSAMNERIYRYGAWKRGVNGVGNRGGGGGGKQLKLIYLSGMFQWNRARAFIDYLENDSIDKRDMCKNVKRSVSRIFKSKNMLF